MEYCEKALAIAIEIGDRQAEGKRNGDLGTLFRSMGEYQKAKECFGRALAIAIEIGDRKKEGTTNGNLGTVYESLGEYQKAKEYCEKALAIAKKIGDRKLEGAIDAKLGAVFRSTAENQKAVEYLGTVFRSLGEYQKAKECYEKALVIATEIGDRKGEGKSNGNLGVVWKFLANIRRLKNIAKKHSPSQKKLATDETKATF